MERTATSDGGELSRCQRLIGTRCFVTGAASGIGLGVARRFAQEGALTTLADIDATGVVDAALAVAEFGETYSVVVDVASKPSVLAAMAESVEQMGGVDVVVNCAGIESHHTPYDLPVEEWDRVFAVNARGTFLVAQAGARQMREQGTGGCIINISSVQAEVATGEIAHYAASKGAVRQLTKALAVGFARDGIRVNAIGPGPVATGMSSWLHDSAQRARILGRLLSERPGTPDDIAAAAAYLASDDAGFVTGTTLYVDGGVLAVR